MSIYESKLTSNNDFDYRHVLDVYNIYHIGNEKNVHILWFVFNHKAFLRGLLLIAIIHSRMMNGQLETL